MLGASRGGTLPSSHSYHFKKMRRYREGVTGSGGEKREGQEQG